MAGTVYSFAELRTLFLDAGGPAQWADTMAAVALAESGGCRYALHGPTDYRPVKVCTYNYSITEDSVGLWQINVFAHPQYDRQSLFDPTYNAGAAVAILGGGSPSAWTTYTSGAYKAYLGRAGGAPPGVGGPIGRVTPHVYAGIPGLEGPITTTRTNNVIYAWKHLTHALGVTMPTQAKRARRARNAFREAIR